DGILGHSRPLMTHSSEQNPLGEFWIDVGGTFTDCLHTVHGKSVGTLKLLSDGSCQGLAGSRAKDTITLADIPHKTPCFFTDWQVGLYDEKGNCLGTHRVMDYCPKSRELTVKGSLLNKDLVSHVCRYRLFSGEESPIVAVRWLRSLRL